LEKLTALRAARLPVSHRLRLALAVFGLRLKEYLTLDSFVFRRLTGLVGYAAARLLSACGQKQYEFLLLSKLHRADSFWLANARAEQLAREGANGANHAVAALYQAHIERISASPRTAKFFAHPTRLLGQMALVLKSPTAGEKGVIILLYSY